MVIKNILTNIKVDFTRLTFTDIYKNYRRIQYESELYLLNVLFFIKLFKV